MTLLEIGREIVHDSDMDYQNEQYIGRAISYFKRALINELAMSHLRYSNSELKGLIKQVTLYGLGVEGEKYSNVRVLKYLKSDEYDIDEHNKALRNIDDIGIVRGVFYARTDSDDNKSVVYLQNENEFNYMAMHEINDYANKAIVFLIGDEINVYNYFDGIQLTYIMAIDEITDEIVGGLNRRLVNNAIEIATQMMVSKYVLQVLGQQ